MFRLFALLLAAFALAPPVHADEASVKKAFEAKFPGAEVGNVSKTPLPGIYEVFADGQLIYSDEGVNYLAIGSIIEVKTKRNLSMERLEKLTEIKWDALPLANAIKTVKGSGKRKIAVFSDPDCPFCRKLEQEFEKITNVTIYTFLYPIASLHPQAGDRAKQIWCSADRGKAYDDYMTKNVAPKAATNCENPGAANVELGRKFNIMGTPALVFPNGRRAPGYVPAAALEKMLDAGNS
jgi:thiol:disulfide interchange protein DsbC